VKQSRRVIAIELDGYWCDYLKWKFGKKSNLRIYHRDFLLFPLPKKPYKVFANIPFSIEGQIIRRLIESQNPPKDCYLVVVKELAYRLCAPYKQNLFSITHKPFFDFSIYHHFRKTDFTPATSVDCVVMYFILRNEPLLPFKERRDYQFFVKRGFGQGLPIYRNLRPYYPNNILRNAFKILSVNRSVKPGYLSLDNWLELYKMMNREKYKGILCNR
jgi:23S rRNA (adenine-N6)-dimethyltransferase